MPYSCVEIRTIHALNCKKKISNPRLNNFKIHLGIHGMFHMIQGFKLLEMAFIYAKVFIRARTVRDFEHFCLQTFVYNLRAADPGPDGFSTHHVVKFHPGDKDYLAEFGAEWLLRKDVPRANPNDEKRKAMAAKKKAPSAEAAVPEQVLLACFLVQACISSFH
jgi:hypothetical protein